VHYYSRIHAFLFKMNSSRVEALLAELERHKHELEAFDFAGKISDFSVDELKALSAKLDRIVDVRRFLPAPRI
jgi:HAMP domain-containing protein